MIEMTNNKKTGLIIMFAVISIIMLAIYITREILGISDFAGLQKFLLSNERMAKYIYFIICFLQPIILSIPEPVTIISGSSVFGPFEGAVIGFIGTILGIIVMFLLSRFASKRFIAKLIDSDKLEKFNRYMKRNEIIVLSVLFIFPILPDEIICAGSGLTKINGYKFMVIAVISKLITSFSLSYSLKIMKVDLNSILILLTIIIFFVCIKLYKAKKISFSRGEE